MSSLGEKLSFNENHVKFFSKTKNGEVYEVKEQAAEPRLFYKFKRHIYFYDVQTDKTTSVGYFYIYTSKSIVIDRVKYDFFLVIANAVFKTFILWLLFLFFIRKIITIPLSALSDATERFGTNANEGGKPDTALDHLLRSTCRDELGELANRFIAMRSLVLEKIAYIAKQNEFLELKVKERTAALVEINKELKRLSLHDPLTGMPNRNLFHDRLQFMIDCAKREGENFSVGSIDLKKFKNINDQYGHQAGDAVLVELSKRIKSVIRESDTLARMGGDEFAVILKARSNEELSNIGERIVACAFEPVIYQGQSILAGIDIGISCYSPGIKSPEVLFKNADIAMYYAKNNDTGIAIFTPKIDEKAGRYATISSGLDNAIEKRQLIVYYQPIIDCKTFDVVGAEALLRWNHPELGFIPPNEFIPIAERDLTIKALTEWVFDESLRFSNQLSESGHIPTISINLSGRLLSDKNLSTALSSLCLGRGASLHNIKIELTESSMMNNPKVAIENIQILKAMGFKISIDDFGTGYSSFSYLVRFAVDELKIDRSFFFEFEKTENKMVVEAIINLAHNLNLDVVAEGIETEEMALFAQNYRCDLMQGFYFCKPKPAMEYLSWVNQWQSEKEKNLIRKSS